MDTRKLSIGLVSLALLTGASAWVVAGPAEPPAAGGAKAGQEADEEVIDLAKAPDAVRAAAIQLAGSEKAIKKVIKEEDEDDIYTYEVEYAVDGVDCSAVFSTSGDVIEIEKGVKEASLPAAVMAALKKDYPKATFKSPMAVQKFYYEVEIVIDGKAHEVKVDAAGNIEDGHEGDGEHEKAEKGEKEEHGKKHEKD